MQNRTALVIFSVFVLVAGLGSLVQAQDDEDDWTVDSDVCEDEVLVGACDPDTPQGQPETRFYYNPAKNECFNMRYCDGANLNNFKTYQMCELFCISNDDKPNIFDITYIMNHQAGEDRHILATDEFRRDLRLRLARYAEVEPEYVRQVNAVPRQNDLLVVFKIVKDARIMPYVAGQVFLSKMEQGLIEWEYETIPLSAVKRSEALIYGTNVITVQHRDMLIAFGAVAVILGFASCIGTICMCTFLNRIRKTTRDALEKAQEQRKHKMHV